MGKTFFSAILVPVVLILSFGQYTGCLLFFSAKATDYLLVARSTKNTHVPVQHFPDVRAEWPDVSSPPDSFQIKEFNPRHLLDSLSSYHRDSLLEVWSLYLTLIDSMRANTSPYKNQDFRKTSPETASDLPSETERTIPDPDPEASSVSEKTDTSRLPVKEEKREGRAGSGPKNDSAESGYVFFVQIGASRTPLDSAELKKRYNGPEKPRLKETGEWYKYQIGRTDNYIEAYLTLRSVNTPDAFIVVYDGDGNKLKLWRVILEQRRKIPEFRVQVAASQVKLSEERLAGIYSGDREVKEITEDGWHKYQIDAGTTLQEAWEMVQETGVENAFPVVYLKGRKLDLFEVVRIFNLQ